MCKKESKAMLSKEARRGAILLLVASDDDFLTQRFHVVTWYILRAVRASHTATLRPKYTPYSYMDPLAESIASGF